MPAASARLGLGANRRQKMSQTVVVANDTIFGFGRKQFGDECELILAGQLTLAGVPTMNLPDGFPNFDLIALPHAKKPLRTNTSALKG